MLGMVTENPLYFRSMTNRTAFAEARTASFPQPASTYEKGGQLIDLSFWRDRSGGSTNRELVRGARAALAAARRVARREPRTAENHCLVATME